MNFEEALKTELETISGLNKKVFPLNASEGTKPPYLVYLQQGGNEGKTLDGYIGSGQSNYELNVIHSTYKGMKDLSKLIITKIKTFPQRKIGTDGPYIKDISYDDLVELYELEPNLYRAYIEIRIFY